VHCQVSFVWWNMHARKQNKTKKMLLFMSFQAP
jgi:hypothetical protein